MTEKKFISVGKLSKPHGIHGALVFVSDLNFSDEIGSLNHFFVMNKGIYEPLFISKIEFTRENSGHVSIEGILTRSDAEKLANKEVFLTEEEAGKYLAEEEEIESYAGYKAFNGKEEIGIVIGIEEMPMQDMFIIEKDNKEIMIPAVEEFITKIDSKKQQIIFELPEGLLEL